MDDFDDSLDLVGLTPAVKLPNLNHWKSVMEFSIEQAALLLAMIDPFDCDELFKAKAKKLDRWKEAHGHALGIVSAIRQGLISPVVCKGYTWIEAHDQYGNPGMEKVLTTVKPSDREAEISQRDTIITRASLLAWIESERVQITRPPRLATKTVSVQVATQPAPSAPLTISFQGHKSEGLEFVEDAIKQFWSTYDPDDHTTAPSKAEVVEYLKKKGATGNVAEAVDKILRPEHLRKAHLKNHKVLTREDE